MLSGEEVDLVRQVIEAFGWFAFASTALLFALYGIEKRSLMYPNILFWLGFIPTIVAAFFIPFGTLSLHPGAYSELTPQCNAQAVIGHYGFMSWSITIMISAVWLYLLLSNSKVLLRTEDEVLTIYCTLCYIVPLLPVLVALIANVYGPLGSWCFISTDWYGYGWILGLFYIPVAVCITIAAVFVLLSMLILRQRIKSKLRNERRHYEYNDEQWYHLQLRLVAFLICFILITWGLLIYAFVRTSKNNRGEDASMNLGETITVIVFAFLLFLLQFCLFISTKTPFSWFINKASGNRKT